MGLLDSYGDQLPDLMPDVGQNQKPEPPAMPEPPKLRSAMRVTQGMQPDQLANDMRMGKTVGLPADFVAADREAVKQKIEEDNAEQALAGAPATRNHLAGNPHTMALTKDDLPNAARLEAILTGEIQPSRTSDPKLAVGLDGTPYLDYSSVPTDQSTGFDWLFKSASQALKAGGYNTAYGLKAYGHMVAGTDPTKDQALMALLDEAKQAPQANGLLEKMWAGGFGAIPMLGSGMLRGATYGAAASGMAGLAAAPLAGGLAATGVGAPAGAAVEGGATAAAGAAGFTFGMFHDIYMQTSGAKYAELIQQGVDPATAQKTAMAVGGVNAALMSARFSPAWLSKLPVIGPALEKAGAQQAIDQVLAQPTIQAAAKGFIVHVAKDTGKNGVLGASMAVVDQLGTAAAMGVQQGLEGQDLLKFIGTQASSPEFWQHAAESGKNMAIDMAGFAVIPGARGLVRDFQAVERAKVDRAVFEALDENVGQSKLRERMPDAHADLVEAIREQNGGTMPENVYVDPKALREASGLQGDTFYQMLTQIGVDPADFNLSEALDAPLAIPMKDYASRVAGTDLSAKLRDDMKFDPEGMTAREAQAFEAERDARVAELKQQYEQNKEQHDADFEAAKQEKFDQLMNGAELQGGVKMTRADAEAQLAPMFKMAERAAERWRAMGSDVTAADLLRKATIQWEEPGRQRIEPKPGIPGIDRISDTSLMNMADAGVGDVPLSIFHGDKDLVRKLGLVYEERIADPETGEMRPVEMVNTAPLWAERKRRNDIETSSRKAPTAEEINASIERRAQWYEKLAKEQEDLGDRGDKEHAASLRKKAADARARKQPDQWEEPGKAKGTLYQITPEVAKGLNYATELPADPVFHEAVQNTPGAQVTPDGLLINLTRFQKGEQAGGRAIRTGVFYLPAKSADARHYRGSNQLGYGGEERFTGETLLRKPLFVKGATGGEAPEQAYSDIKGKDALKEMIGDAYKAIISTGNYMHPMPMHEKVGVIEKFIEKYAPDYVDSGLADEIVMYSQKGNTLRYALQELAVAQAVRDAGYDSVVGYSNKKVGPAISEVFDVREQTFPSKYGDAEIHDRFMQRGGADPRILMQSIGDRIASALKDTSGPKPEAEVALPPRPDTLYQVQNLPEWRDKTSAWMEKNGYSAEEIQKHLAAIDGQMKIFQALGPAELEMLPQGAGNNPGKGKGPIRTNADPIYKITFDASAMCVKRLEAAATATYVQAQLGRALTTSERMALVALFRAAGKAAPCVYCYVEAPRSKSGEFVKTATDVALGQAPKDSWSDSLKQAALEAQAEAKQLGLKPGDIDPNVVLDPEYAQSAEARAKLEQAPKVYQFMKSQMLAAKANLPKLYEEYNGQILDLDQKLLNELNSYAGLRFFSSSDFQAEHVADLMQAVHDMDVRQAKAHAYTKVPDFVRIFGDTGIKIQTSIFAKEEGGKIVMDDWQGMNWDEAKAFREKHANVGTVLVASSDNIVAWALKQPWIDYIIPFHYSGLEKKFYGTLGWEDFTSTQREKALGGGKAEKIRQHETGSAEGITNEQGTRNYLTLAMERKLTPVFPAFMFKDFEPGGDRAKQTRDAVARWTEMVNKGEIDWSQINPEYYKLRKDYARTDTPFDAVKAKVDLDAAGEVLDKYMAGETPKAQVDPQIADKLVGMIKGAEGSNRDIGVEALQAAKANRELFQAAYHGSPRTLNQEPVQKKDLVAAHNLSEQNLQFADKIGGLPVPSIGITKAVTPFDGFGNITLIGHKDMVDPSRGVPVFSADAYSARFPEVLWPKVKTKDAQRFMNESRPYFDEFKDGGASNVWDSLVNSPSRDRALEDFTRGGMLGARAMYADQVLGKKVDAPIRDVPHEHLFVDKQLIKDAKDLRYEDVEPGGKDAHTFSEAVKNAIDRSFTQQMEQAGESTFRKNAAERLKEAYLSRFFKDGELTYAGADSVLRDIRRAGEKEVDVAAAEKQLDALVPKEDPAFLKWAADKIGSMFGDPSIKVGGRKVPMSLENLVDAMSTRNVRGKEKTMTFGGGRLAAEASKQFKSIEEIQAERDRVVSPEDHNADVKSADKNLEAYRTSVLAFFTQKDYRGDIDTWAGLDAATKALADAAKKGGGEQSIRSALIRNGFKGVNARTVSLAKQALDSVKQAKVDYFEAKPQRGVKLNEFMGAVIPAKTSPEARAILGKNGLRIAEYDGTPEGRAKALDSLSSDLEQQRPGVLFSSNRSGTKGSITFDPEQAVIRLFKGNADFSTLLHETAHYFVREMQDMVETGRAPEQVFKDLETMAKFAGDLEGVPAQEKLARAFELYLREGKAPSPEMVKPFQRFQAWLTAIYRNVKAQLGLEEVPTEMRGVFDRMLAADDEIRMAEGVAGRKAELESVAKGYLTAGEQKRLKDLNTKASSDAKEKLTKKYLKAYFKALGGKTELEKQARAEVESQQVYSTISDIAQKGWLSFDALVKEYGEKVTRELSFRFPGLVAQEGVLPRHTFDLGTIAIAHGYDGAESMMADILGAKAKGTSIKELTEQKIAAEESRVLDGLNPNAAEEIHNDASLSALILEGLALQRKAVEKGAQTRKINSEAIKQVTQAILADMPVSKAGVYTRFSSAARRASEEARKAIAVGDWEKAATAKQREALNHALVIEAVKARDMVAKQVKTIIREAKAKKLDFEAREQIMALTATYGIGPRGMKPMKPEELTGIRDYFTKVYGAEDDLAMNPVGFFNDWSLNREQLGSYKNLTVSQMNELHALVSALADAGGSEYTRMASEATMTRQAQLDKMIESVNNSGYQTKQYDRGTTTQMATSAFRDVMASLQRMPDIFRNADGNVDAAPKNAHLMGPNQEFAERLHLGNRKALEILYSHKDLPEIEAAKVAFAKRFKKQFGERTPEVNGVPVSPVRKIEGMHTWTAESIWCVALNMGNEGNLRTLIQGDGLTMDQLVKLTSVLSERDWKAIQAQWDLLGKHYAETDKVFRKVYNFPMPNRVKPKELTVRTAEGNDLTLPGGYFPIKVDRDINPDIGAKQEQDLIKGDPSNKFAASIAKGHTKERLGTSRPVALSYEVAHRAMLDQARFIALAPIIKDAQAIYTSPEYRRAMIDAFGKEAYDGILPWLKNIASPTIEGKDHFDNALSKLRHLSTLYILGLNLKSATKQYLGLAGTANKLGVKWTASGLTEMAKWGGMGKDFVDEKSAFMRNREEGLNPELAEINAKARGNEFRLFGIKTGLPKKKVVDAVMVLTRLTDRHVTYSTWLGAYKKGLQELGLADSEAVDFADRIVRRTQMSGSAVDTTGWQRSEGAKRLLTMFMSEAIPKSSRMRSDFTAFKNGNMTAAQYGRSLFYETIAPAVGYTALMGLMGGEDKKSWFKDLFWQLYSETFGLFPLLGGVQSAVEFNKPVAGTPSLEALDIFTNVGKAAVKLHDDHSSEGKARMYKALIDATAYIHGVGNLRRIYETAAEGWKDIDHNKTVNPFRLFIRKPKDQ